MKSPVSLYDALINAQIPGDKARAVAEALESDMSEHLASKQDLLLLRKDMEAGLASVRKDSEVLRKDMDAGFALLRTEVKTALAAQTNKLTIVLGSIMAAGVGLVAALQQLLR